jgi:hypothetical protein
MASKKELLRRLAALTTEEVVNLLHDDSVLAAAADYFERSDAINEQHLNDIPTSTSNPDAPSLPSSMPAMASTLSEAGKRTRQRPRAVNAFVAFRSEYIMNIALEIHY